MLYTSLLYTTAPIHCTPPATATPFDEYPAKVVIISSTNSYSNSSSDNTNNSNSNNTYVCYSY